MVPPFPCPEAGILGLSGDGATLDKIVGISFIQERKEKCLLVTPSATYCGSEWQILIPFIMKCGISNRHMVSVLAALWFQTELASVLGRCRGEILATGWTLAGPLSLDRLHPVWNREGEPGPAFSPWGRSTHMGARTYP